MFFSANPLACKARLHARSACAGWLFVFTQSRAPPFWLLTSVWFSLKPKWANIYQIPLWLLIINVCHKINVVISEIKQYDYSIKYSYYAAHFLWRTANVQNRNAAALHLVLWWPITMLHGSGSYCRSLGDKVGHDGHTKHRPPPGNTEDILTCPSLWDSQTHHQT